MNKIFCLLFLLFSINSSAQFKFEDFKNLHSLAGMGWQMEMKKGSLIEKWGKVNDSLLISKSYRINGADTTTLETVELKYSNGVITYAPTVPDQNEGKPVTFTLISIQNWLNYTFENKQHDYPQQIIYQLGGKSLKVTIRALNDPPEKERHFNFTHL